MYVYMHVDPDSNQMAVDSFHIQQPYLDRLWVYSCPLTHGRQVTALTWNPQNQVPPII